MYIIAFILFLFGLSKLLLIISATYNDLKEVFTSTEIVSVKTIIKLLIVESIFEIVCSLYILL